MDWPVVAALLAPVVALAALYGQMRHWHRQALQDREQDVRERAEQATQLSRDVEGNTAATLQIKQALEKHEDHCRERWGKNWAQHEEMRDRIAKLEGARTG